MDSTFRTFSCRRGLAVSWPSSRDITPLARLLLVLKRVSELSSVLLPESLASDVSALCRASVLTPGAPARGSTDPPLPDVELGCVLYPPEVPLAGCDWADAEIENPIATAKARGRIGNFDT